MKKTTDFEKFDTTMRELMKVPAGGASLEMGLDFRVPRPFTFFEAVRKLGVMGVRDPFGIFLFGWTAALRNQEVRRLGC